MARKKINTYNSKARFSLQKLIEDEYGESRVSFAKDFKIDVHKLGDYLTGRSRPSSVTQTRLLLFTKSNWKTNVIRPEEWVEDFELDLDEYHYED